MKKRLLEADNFIKNLMSVYFPSSVNILQAMGISRRTLPPVVCSFLRIFPFNRRRRSVLLCLQIRSSFRHPLPSPFPRRLLPFFGVVCLPMTSHFFWQTRDVSMATDRLSPKNRTSDRRSVGRARKDPGAAGGRAAERSAQLRGGV